MKVKYGILSGLSVFVVGLDQITKYVIYSKFKLGETVAVISDFFNITYVQNKGAAFGMMAQADPLFRVPFFIAVPLIALAAITYIFRKIPDKDYFQATSFSLIMGGALGNLIDRVVHGFVVDFLDFHWKWTYHFPAFNVADSAICIGVGMIILGIMTQGEGQTAGKQRVARAHE